VAYLDADDWWRADKIERQLVKLQETGADVCYSGRELMRADGESTGRIIKASEHVTYRQLLKNNVIPCSSVLLKRSEALAYPMTHDELHEDYIVWLQMLRDGKRFVGIDEPLLKSRMAENGKSRDKLRSAKMTYGVYRYLGIPRWKAWYYFCCYAVSGIKKYKGKRSYEALD
jgi:teichuronic acid biosynthesis glycosyltransferase TuaG